MTYTFKNSPTMIAGLQSVQESHDGMEGGSGFYGILRASELVPYDSAIFISTDKIPQDLELMRNAATTLLKKRIRVQIFSILNANYVFISIYWIFFLLFSFIDFDWIIVSNLQLFLIWFGAQDIDDNETSTGGALGEVALRSGGEIIRITEESLGNGDMGLVSFVWWILSLCQNRNFFQLIDWESIKLLQVTHFLENDIQGAQVIDIPVNTTDTNLHIKIQGNVDQATLTTPIGG